MQLLKANAPKQSGDQEQIVFQASDGKKISSPAVKATVNAVLTQMAEALPHVTSDRQSPYSPEGAAQVSPRTAPSPSPR